MASNAYDAQASTNYKEAFSLFDKRGNGRVSLDNLGDLLRACGQNPTMTEIRDLEKTVGGDCECSTLSPPILDMPERVLRRVYRDRFAQDGSDRNAQAWMHSD